MKYFKFLILAFFFSNCKPIKTVNITQFQKTDKPSTIINFSRLYFKDIDNNYSNFIGTWDYTFPNTNTTFRLILWKNTKVKVSHTTDTEYFDILEGKFQIIENLGQNSENVLHDSVKTYPQNGVTTTSILTGFSIDPDLCVGLFSDNCANGGNGGIEGNASLRKITPTTLRFTIKKVGRLSSGETFTVPSDALLTKIN